MQLFTYLVTEGVRNQHTHLALALQVGLHKAGKELGLADHRGCFPLLAGIDKLLPAHIQTRQVVVGIEVFDQMVQTQQQRGLAGLPGVVNEFAITLIQLEPSFGVLVHTIGQRIHLQLHQLQLLNELRTVFKGQIHVLVAFKPMPLPTKTHALLDILSGHRAGHHLAHQLTQDLAVNGLKLIDCRQLAVVQCL